MTHSYVLDGLHFMQYAARDWDSETLTDTFYIVTVKSVVSGPDSHLQFVLHVASRGELKSYVIANDEALLEGGVAYLSYSLAGDADIESIKMPEHHRLGTPVLYFKDGNSKELVSFAMEEFERDHSKDRLILTPKTVELEPGHVEKLFQLLNERHGYRCLDLSQDELFERAPEAISDIPDVRSCRLIDYTSDTRIPVLRTYVSSLHDWASRCNRSRHLDGAINRFEILNDLEWELLSLGMTLQEAFESQMQATKP